MMFLHQRQLRRILLDVERRLWHLECMMAALDDRISDLTADVQAENTVIDSAVTLIEGIAAEIKAAVDAATAAGATPVELQALTDLHTSVVAKSAALANAVAQNVPPPTPQP